MDSAWMETHAMDLFLTGRGELEDIALILSGFRQKRYAPNSVSPLAKRRTAVRAKWRWLSLGQPDYDGYSIDAEVK
jgi:hypothetical protein